MPFPTDVIAPFAAQARAVADSPSIPEWEQIREQVALYAERAIRGLLSVEETLVALDARADAILAKRRALVQAGKLT
jgi:1-deoxy-D-xylulose 5-phosphate reductoisomerase